jgi:glycosyltransferase involved in cell wall biosynthesis
LPRVSVITRTRNRHVLLRRAVESVLGQSFARWEHVIVNDGGDADALDAFLEPFRERYAGRLIVVHNPLALGMQQATNAGLARASGTFAAIHDDDDAWHEDFLNATVAFLDDKGPDSVYQGVVTHSVRVLEDMDSKGEVLEVERAPYLPALDVNLFRLGFENPFPPIAFLYRRKAHEIVGSFDPRFDVVGDMDFNLRFLLRWEIGVIARPLAFYHWRRDGGSAELHTSVVAESRTHGRLLNEFLNQQLRSDKDSVGLALNIARYVVGIETMSGDVKERLADFKAHLASLSDCMIGNALPRVVDLKAHLDSFSGILEGIVRRQEDSAERQNEIAGRQKESAARQDRADARLDGIEAAMIESARSLRHGFNIGPVRVAWMRRRKRK